MQYRLIITERAEEHLDNILHYIVYKLKNPQAAGNLISEITHVYDNLEENPKIYAYCEEHFLKAKGYRKAPVSHYDYAIIYKIDADCVYIMGIFHDLELYKNKL